MPSYIDNVKIRITFLAGQYVLLQNTQPIALTILKTIIKSLYKK
jgi:hypothetical protein